MNLAQMLSERMKSPGAMGAFKDVSSNPDALAYVQHGNDTQMTGSDKQQAFPMDTGGVDDEPSSQDSAPQTPGFQPGDAGVGMLEHAHSMAHGKSKAALGKAIAHGKAKHAAKHGHSKHMKK